MPDPTQDSQALALGTLIGTVNGLSKTLEDQNKNRASDRTDFMEVFKGIRTDIQTQLKVLQDHIKEDAVNSAILTEVANWRSKDAGPKVDKLWDIHNRQAGAFLSIGMIGSVVGGLIVAFIEWFKK